jgi:hypothetical protein
MLNIVQHQMFDHDCEASLFLTDNSNFPLPYLETVAGTIEYELTNANLSQDIAINGYATSVRSVKDLFIRIDTPYNVDYNRQFWRENFNYTNINPWYTKSLAHVTFQRGPAQFIPKRGIQNAKVVFPEDPSTYTNRWFVECYLNPVELSSESIPLSVNSDQFFDVVLDGVVGLIEQAEHGKSERYDRFMQLGLKKFWSESNKGAENRPLKIQTHEC